MLPSSSYAASSGWEGYSTPWVLFNDGRFEMFVDAFRSFGKHSIQTSLLHLRSDDGVRFTEAAADILVAGRESWADISVRSPSVVVSDGIWRMWYAGDNYDPQRNKPSGGRIDAGIGLAVLRVR